MDLDELATLWRDGGIARSAERQAVHRVAGLLREAARALVVLDAEAAGAAPLDEAADDLRAWLDRLEALPDIRPDTPATTALPASLLFERSPVTGLGNPVATPLTIRYGRERTTATAVYTEAHEGPPGGVHGGIVAAAFDEVLGVAQMASGAAGFTGRLEVRFHAVTPLHTPVTYEAWVAGRQGKKLTVEARSVVGDTLLAEATGLFIVQLTLPVPPDLLDQTTAS